MCGIPLFELKKCAKEWKEVFKGMIFGAKKAPFESELKYNTRRNSQNPPILPDSLRERRHPQGGVRVAQWADVRYFGKSNRFSYMSPRIQTTHCCAKSITSANTGKCHSSEIVHVLSIPHSQLVQPEFLLTLTPDYGEMPSATSCLESEPELLAEAPPRGVKRRKGRRATPIDI